MEKTSYNPTAINVCMYNIKIKYLNKPANKSVGRFLS